MSKTLYLETSILGYLTARPNKNLIVASNMLITQEWWNLRRRTFEIYISQVVINEVRRGDEEIAKQRLSLLKNIPLLDLTDTVKVLARQFIEQSNLPNNASDDAIHIAVASVYNLDYLLTWNCKHIANAHIQKKLAQIASQFGYELPTICTPYELMEE
jgi:predicted nucleic acid-binding protein